MQIHAVTFDVGGTLVRPWPSVGHVYAEAAARHGLKNLSAEDLNARFKAAWAANKQFENSRVGWQALVDQMFRGLAAEPPSKTFFPELYERFAEPEVWRIFDDVLPALDALASAGVRLGVISNWDERLRGLLKGLRLHKYFETLTISCEAGFSKPSPVIFEHAAASLGLPPAAIVHVGDSLEMDVLAAKAAGFHALRIGRETISTGDTIKSLTEIGSRIRNRASAQN